MGKVRLQDRSPNLQLRAVGIGAHILFAVDDGNTPEPAPLAFDVELDTTGAGHKERSVSPLGTCLGDRSSSSAASSDWGGAGKSDLHDSSSPPIDQSSESSGTTPSLPPPSRVDGEAEAEAAISAAGTTKEKKLVGKWATPRDWEPYREKLTRLWWYENKTMEEVRTIMEEEGFCATPKMYRDRFRRWGLLKNFKAKDTKAIVGAIKQHGGQGTGTTEVLVRGRRVDFRWRIRRSKLASLNKACEDAAALELAALPDNVQILNPLVRPSEMGGSTAGLHIIREYVDCQGCFDSWRRHSSLTWAESYDLAITPQIHDFFSGWYHGSTLLLTGSTNQDRIRGSRMLNLSFTTFRGLILRQTPCFLLRYARAVTEVNKSFPNSDRLCRMMARYAKDLCTVTYGAQHPFTRVLGILNADILGLEPGQETGRRNLELASVLMRAYLDMIKQSRACNAMVLSVYFDSFWNLLSGNKPSEREIDSFIAGLEDMIAGFDATSPHRPSVDGKTGKENGPQVGENSATDRMFAVSAIKRTMAELLGHSADPAKRQRGADLLKDMLGAPPVAGEPFFYRQWLQFVSLAVEARAGRLDGAEEHMRAALRGAEALGYGTPPHLGALFTLKGFLDQTGRVEEARALEPDCEQVLRLREGEHGIDYMALDFQVSAVA